MVFAAVLVNADHAALEYAKEAFDRVRCRLAARIFAVAVVDGLMLGKFLAERLVMLRFVRVERAV